MIRLKKIMHASSTEPTLAVHHKAIKWLATLRRRYPNTRRALLRGRKLQQTYREKGIEAAVLWETHDKCAYCETKRAHIDSGSVEQILPGNGSLDGCLDYTNLTFVCNDCAKASRAHDDRDAGSLLDPYKDDPERFLRACGGFVFPTGLRCDHRRAERTIGTVDLNRVSLLERRQEFVKKSCIGLLQAYLKANAPPLREALRTRMNTICADGSEYAMTARTFFRSVGIDIAGPNVLDSQSKERMLVGEVIAIVARAGQLCRELNTSDNGVDMEVEFKDTSGWATGRKVYLQLKSGDSYLKRRSRDGAEIFRVPKARHADYWRRQAVPLLLVIRQSNGDIRWMDIRQYLRGADVKQRPMKQIVFHGERFDVGSVLGWQERFYRLAPQD